MEEKGGFEGLMGRKLPSELFGTRWDLWIERKMLGRKIHMGARI